MKKLTYERLREVLEYDPVTGIFTWKERIRSDGRRDYHSGKIAGTLHPKGYIQIKIDEKKYLGHRLAWLYTHGYLPEHQIDHKNQIRNDNEIKNLREVTRSCNMQNCKINKNSISGVTGVRWDKRAKRWHARIQKNNKGIHLGYFSNLTDAAQARYAAEQIHFTCTIKSSAKVYIDNHI